MQRAITLSPSSSASQSPSPSPFPSIPSSSNTISQKKKKEPEMASHTLFLFLLLSLAFQLFVSLPEDYYHECTTVPYSCGGLHLNVSYPFLIDHRPGYCGHPDFLLSCINDNTTLMITINGTGYQVKDIDYPNELLTVVDTNFVGQTCPHTYQNTTLDPSLFRLSDHDLNLSLYFNCTSLLDIPTLYDIACLAAIFGKHSYYRLDNQSFPDFVGPCFSTALVPLDRYAAEQLWNVGANLTAALQQGFSLNWIPGSDWCSGCTNSGGICGYNSSSPPEHTCFCSNFTGTDSCNSPGKHNPRTKEIKLGVIAASASVLFVCLLSFLYCQGCKKSQGSIIFWKKRSSNVQKVEAFLEKYGSLAPRRYRYSDVKKITKSFKYKLGQGGYGTVFKGNFLDGRPVAVKILNDAKGNGEEFVNEVASIGKTSHVNVVKLLGFCSERSKRALIYDFMPNGSLEKFIYIDRTRSETPLGWEKLYEIAVGIAHGLEYLHRGCNARIVHFDIKPHNILLDQDFCPKISDFGLAKLCLTKESIVSMTGARGTVGYIAPEVFLRNFGTVSCKSDVYSFGMMLLEMAGGRRNIDASVENASEFYFPHWIYDHLEHDVDLEACGITSETAEIARKMILVGLWCIQMIPENRPSMNKVVDMLEGSIRDLQMPPKP